MPQAASPLPGAGGSLLHLFEPSAYIRQHQPRNCGLVLLGYSSKPYGSREPLGQLLSSLMNAHVVVIGRAPELDRAASRVPSIAERRIISVHRSLELVADDEEIRYAVRQQVLLHPSFQLKVHSRIWNPA
jgi:hypothetical protein